MFHIFKRKTYHWWQIGLLKIAMLAVGIAIGTTWPGVFTSYATHLVVLGIALGIYLFVVWARQ